LSPYRRRSAALAVALATLVALAACGNSSGSSAKSGGPVKGKTVRVGAVFLDAQGFYGGVKAGFEAAAKSADVTLKLTESNPGGDASKEASFVSTLVNSKPDALIISAASTAGSVPAIKSAAKAGVPVVCYNTCVGQEDIAKYVSAYVQGDPVKFGANTGEAAAAYFLKNKITNPNIAVVNCEFVEVCKLRRQGFESVLKEKVPGYKIVSNQAGTTDDKAVSVAANQIRAHSDLDAIYGESGGATYGAYKAITAAGKQGKIVVFGSDMTTDIAKALADGAVIKSITDISGKVTGELVWEQVKRVLEGDDTLGTIVDAPINGYTADDKAGVQNWLTTHADGLP
jgi:sugar transport system substrate-binding protein